MGHLCLEAMTLAEWQEYTFSLSDKLVKQREADCKAGIDRGPPDPAVEALGGITKKSAKLEDFSDLIDPTPLPAGNVNYTGRQYGQRVILGRSKRTMSKTNIPLWVARCLPCGRVSTGHISNYQNSTQCKSCHKRSLRKTNKDPKNRPFAGWKTSKTREQTQLRRAVNT